MNIFNLLLPLNMGIWALVGNVYACEGILEIQSQDGEHKLSLNRGLFDFHHVHKQEILAKDKHLTSASPLGPKIGPIVRYVDGLALRTACEQEFRKRSPDYYQGCFHVGLYHVINLSTLDLTIQGNLVTPHTYSVFASCYDKYATAVALKDANTLFMSLNLQEDYARKNAFSVCENIMPLTHSHQAIIFRDAENEGEATSAKNSLLHQFETYAERPSSHHHELSNAFPQFALYLSNPTGYAAEIAQKRVVFTYETTINMCLVD